MGGSGASEASLTHQKVFHSIMLIMKHANSFDKTLVRFFNDKTFEIMQDIVLDIETYYAIVSVDRRSQKDQENNRFIILSQARNDGCWSNKLVKLNFEEDKCDSEDILYSKDLVQELLSSCHTVNDDLIVALHKYSARLYDGNLICKQYAKWDDLLPAKIG